MLSVKHIFKNASRRLAEHNYHRTVSATATAHTIRFAAVADQDKLAFNKQLGAYVSFLQHGQLQLDLNNPKHSIDIQFTLPDYNLEADLTNKVDADTKAIMLTTTVGDEFHRGAELSDLTLFNDKLITAGDRSGIVHEIDDNFDLHPIAKLFLSEQGTLKYLYEDALDETQLHNKGYKIEWMTVKQDHLYIGGTGLEQYDLDSNTVKKGAVSIARYDKQGKMSVQDWTENFNRIRMACGAIFPGWIYIECLIWSEHHHQWFVLPRFTSTEAPFTDLQGNYGGTFMMRCSEDFEDIELVHIALKMPLVRHRVQSPSGVAKEAVEPDWDGARRIGLWTAKDVDAGELKKNQEEVARSLFYCDQGVRGFSCAQFVPGTDDSVIMALRTKENGEDISSSICVFDIHGKVFEDYVPFKGNRKYEGLVIL